MSKKLNEMTLTELWTLFPIELRKHNPKWVCYYEEEKEVLATHFDNLLEYSLYHVGSTAVKDIKAKPIVDILMTAEKSKFDEITKILEQNYYLLMSKDENRMSFNKGYTVCGYEEKVYHLHLREKEDCDEIYFCKYLNEFSNIAKEYEKLKISLADVYKFDRDAYTEAKSEFVNNITLKAKKYFETKTIR